MNEGICLVLRTFIETYKRRNVQVQTNEYCLEKQVFICIQEFYEQMILKIVSEQKKKKKKRA